MSSTKKSKKSKVGITPKILLGIAEMYNDGGFSVAEISEELGINTYMVKQYAYLMRKQGYAIKRYPQSSIFKQNETAKLLSKFKK